MPSNTKWRRKQIQQLILVVFLFAGLIAGVFYYSHYREISELLPVQFELTSGKKTRKFYLEIANTHASRKKGLMYRKEGELAADRGMIFVFPKERIQSFWMKNTYIPLDIIFVNSELEVVGMANEVPALSGESQRVDKPSIYVVELLAGVAKKHGITPGAKLKVLTKMPEAK